MLEFLKKYWAWAICIVLNIYHFTKYYLYLQLSKLEPTRSEYCILKRMTCNLDTMVIVGLAKFVRNVAQNDTSSLGI